MQKKKKIENKDKCLNLFFKHKHNFYQNQNDN